MPRGVTDSHKKAMQQGRKDSAAVDAYLKAIARPKRRGRPVSVEELSERRKNALAEASAAEGITRLKGLQAAADLQERIDAASSGADDDLAALEGSFIAVAKRYSERHGITYATWREAAVPASVLKRAGVHQTRRRT